MLGRHWWVLPLLDILKFNIANQFILFQSFNSRWPPRIWQLNTLSSSNSWLNCSSTSGMYQRTSSKFFSSMRISKSFRKAYLSILHVLQKFTAWSSLSLKSIRSTSSIISLLRIAWYHSSASSLHASSPFDVSTSCQHLMRPNVISSSSL